MGESRDLYQVLGLEPDADGEQIRSAFRRLARDHHPDTAALGADPDGRMRALLHAYHVLSDPVARARYDATRSTGRHGGPGTPVPVRHGSAATSAACPLCEGTERRLLRRPCPGCGGSGAIVALDRLPARRPCPTCRTRGTVDVTVPCPRCGAGG